MQSYLRPNQTEFKPSFLNSPDSAEAAEESLANGNGAQLLCQPIKDHQFKPAKGGVNELCVCYSPIPLTLALFLPLYSSFPVAIITTSMLRDKMFIAARSQRKIYVEPGFIWLTMPNKHCWVHLIIKLYCSYSAGRGHSQVINTLAMCGVIPNHNSRNNCHC